MQYNMTNTDRPIGSVSRGGRGFILNENFSIETLAQTFILF